MPNWCYNTLSISGPQEAIERFHADRKTALKVMDCDAEQVITFHQVLPIPKELMVRIKDSFFRLRTPEMIAESNRLIQKYGHDNWYDWSIANWDTKWDAVRSHIDQDGANIHFETAWGPPTKVIRELASSYPELKFIHSFSVEGENGEWEFTYFTEEGTLMVSWECQSGGALPADEVDEHSVP